jgi:hypothetical protein
LRCLLLALPQILKRISVAGGVANSPQPHFHLTSIKLRSTPHRRVCAFVEQNQKSTTKFNHRHEHEGLTPKRPRHPTLPGLGGHLLQSHTLFLLHNRLHRSLHRVQSSVIALIAELLHKGDWRRRLLRPTSWRGAMLRRVPEDVHGPPDFPADKGVRGVC